MLIESYLFNSVFNNNSRENFVDSQPNFIKRFIIFLLEVFIMSVAGFLAWNCNGNQTTLPRVLLTVLSVMFSGLYILFYVIYHVILQNKCPTK